MLFVFISHQSFPNLSGLLIHAGWDTLPEGLSRQEVGWITALIWIFKKNQNLWNVQVRFCYTCSKIKINPQQLVLPKQRRDFYWHLMITKKRIAEFGCIKFYKVEKEKKLCEGGLSSTTADILQDGCGTVGVRCENTNFKFVDVETPAKTFFAAMWIFLLTKFGIFNLFETG